MDPLPKKPLGLRTVNADPLAAVPPVRVKRLSCRSIAALLALRPLLTLRSKVFGQSWCAGVMLPLA